MDASHSRYFFAHVFFMQKRGMQGFSSEERGTQSGVVQRTLTSSFAVLLASIFFSRVPLLLHTGSLYANPA
jgi:hypothetical protein